MNRYNQIKSSDLTVLHSKLKLVLAIILPGLAVSIPIFLSSITGVVIYNNYYFPLTTLYECSWSLFLFFYWTVKDQDFFPV